MLGASTVCSGLAQFARGRHEVLGAPPPTGPHFCDHPVRVPPYSQESLKLKGNPGGPQIKDTAWEEPPGRPKKPGGDSEPQGLAIRLEWCPRIGHPMGAHICHISVRVPPLPPGEPKVEGEPRRAPNQRYRLGGASRVTEDTWRRLRAPRPCNSPGMVPQNRSPMPEVRVRGPQPKKPPSSPSREWPA